MKTKLLTMHVTTILSAQDLSDDSLKIQCQFKRNKSYGLTKKQTG